MPEHDAVISLTGIQAQQTLILDQKVLSFDNINNNYVVDLTYKSNTDVTDSAPGYIKLSTKNPHLNLSNPSASLMDIFFVSVSSKLRAV